MSDKKTNYLKVLCKCCKGDGVQLNKRTGSRILCPCCHGTGISQAPPLKVTFATSGRWKSKGGK